MTRTAISPRLAINTFVTTGRHSVSVEMDERVLNDLATQTRFRDVHILDSTDSTNRVAAELAEAGATEGLVVLADVQTAGRGRLQRTWESAPGAGLLVSVLLRPADLAVEDFHLVTSAAALAATDACWHTAGVYATIKWPNDVLVGERKLAGILAESSGDAVVVGMGLNVHSGPPASAVLDDEAGRRVSRAALLVAWLGRLDALLGDWDEVSRLYSSACSTVGHHVRVERGSLPPLEGEAVSIDRHGRLEVTLPGGETAVISAGDVVHLRAGVPPVPGE
jgi:BirA family biotin operon repressor/biotin-[acetyl-CoA-carboxylase] ligase